MNDAQAVARYFEAWNSRDARAVFDTLAAGGTYTDPTVPDGVSGPEFQAVAEGFMAAFADLSFEVLSVIVSGEGMAAAQWVMRGTHTGPIGSLQPTGRKITFPGVEVFRLRDGKIQSIQAYFDTATLNKQLGL